MSDQRLLSTTFSSVERVGVMSAGVADIAGVERNAAGRFIDFSCSTDWEKSVLKIENFVRGVVLRGSDGDSETLSCFGTKLKITFRCNVQAQSCLSSLFEIDNSFILVSRVDNNWLDCTSSQKYTLLSALVTALQCCCDSLADGTRNVPPIFFTMSNEESIQSSRALDIVGYQICKRLNSSIVVNFSSICQNYNLLEGDREEFRHVDSLSQLFQKHLIEYYRSIDSSQLLSSVIVQVLEKSSVALPSPRPRHEHWATSISESEIFPALPRLMKQIRGISRNMEASVESAVRSVSVSAVLAYPPMKLSSIVDNENYTTLVPARQPPHCWSLRVSFSQTAAVSGSSPSFTLSACVRRLLVSFIHSKSASYVTGQRAKSSSNLSEESSSAQDTSADFAARSAEKSALIAAILSPKTIQLVRTMCSFAEDKEVEDVYVNNLLILLFQDSSFSAAEEVDIFCSAASKTASPSETVLQAKQCAQITVELLSLYAVCAGSLQSFSSSGILWSRFLLVLRSRWDGGTTLPGLNGPRMNEPGLDNAVSESTWSSSAPLRDLLMWEDVLESKQHLSSYDKDRVIDPSLSILAQKLKALQFCIVVREEGTLCNPYGDCLSLQRRLPLTEDAVAQRKFILDKLRPLTRDEAAPVISPLSPLCPDGESSATSDGQDLGAQRQDGSDEAASTEDAVSPSQLQYWRVEQDVVISDMRAWKAEYLADGDACNGFEEFVEWYTGRDEGAVEGGERVRAALPTHTRDIQVVERETEFPAAEEGQGVGGRSWEGVSPSLLLVWSHLWRLCSPACPASEQRPLFSAEQEAEKALGYMGSLDPSQLASELLFAATAAAPAMLLVLIEDHVATAAALVRDICPSTSGLMARRMLGQEEELHLLCATISSARKEMHTDMVHTASDDLRREAAVNQTALLLIDQAADTIERIEAYSLRVAACCCAVAQVVSAAGIVDPEGLRALASVLPSLIHTVCSSGSHCGDGDHSGVFSASSSKEASACSLLAQGISRSNHPMEGKSVPSSPGMNDPSSHRDEKKDRSEIQQKWIPTEKIIKMWLPSPSDVCSPTGEDLEPSSGICLPRQLMRASVMADSLQVCFRFSQEEHY